jgi:hypothetical protein
MANELAALSTPARKRSLWGFARVEFCCNGAHATRYLSRHSLEQKWTTSPFTLRVILATVETYVPHTGSFLSSPPAATGGASLARLCGTWLELELPKRLLSTARTSQKTSRGKIMRIKRKRIMGSGRQPQAAAPGISKPTFSSWWWCPSWRWGSGTSSPRSNPGTSACPWRAGRRGRLVAVPGTC